MPKTTLVDGYTYLVFPEGKTSIQQDDTGGLYHRDTRYLSELAVALKDRSIQRLSTALPEPRTRIDRLVPATTGVNSMADSGTVPKHTECTLQQRAQVRENEGLLFTVTVRNHSPSPLETMVRLRFDTDFADLFEVRGFETDIERPVTRTVADQTVRYEYTVDTDETTGDYATALAIDPQPTSLTPSEATVPVTVSPRQSASVTLRVGFGGLPDARAITTGRSTTTVPSVQSRHDELNTVLSQAAADLSALSTDTDYGLVPLAGTPWFVTPFGRDALITAYQALPVAPALATGTLRYLAAHQGTTDEPVREEAPGKIFHEQRHGELAQRDLVPHTPYFGTIDATPLWVLLLAETCAWHGDLTLAADLAETLASALDWIETTSRAGPADPFLYYTESELGLEHKGWKDTAASVRFGDGSPAEGPLAVAEVQGYAAAALERGHALLSRLQSQDADLPVTATRLSVYQERAEAIETAFNDEFWLPERAFYALAKTADGALVDAATSNIGHCLWTETLPAERAADVASRFQHDEFDTGWGLRTMSATDGGYSPVSYHAGGVWPHDTSLIALGLAQYGYGDVAEQLGKDVLSAATTFRHDRLPELYCGFDSDESPVPYPAACTPQAWAAGAPYAFLRAAFNLHPTSEGELVAHRDSTLFPDTALRTVSDAWGPVTTAYGE